MYPFTAYANGAHGCWFDSYGQPHVLSNNIAYGNDETAVISTESSLEANTFLYDEDDNPAYAVSDEGFISLDPSGLTAPRQADGSLPVVTFLHLAPGSNLVDSGVDVGLPFRGAAPDLGAFEN